MQRIEIAAPAADVWAVLADVERWPEWTPTMKRVELIDRHAFAVGARARVHQPRLPTAVWTVTVIDPVRYFEWRSVAPGLRSAAGHRVEAGTSGTTVVTLTFEWSGFLEPLIRLVYGSLARRYVQTESESLKRRCEMPHRRRAGAGS